jgi:hypothetical protein
MAKEGARVPEKTLRSLKSRHDVFCSIGGRTKLFCYSVVDILPTKLDRCSFREVFHADVRNGLITSGTLLPYSRKLFIGLVHDKPRCGTNVTCCRRSQDVIMLLFNRAVECIMM